MSNSYIQIAIHLTFHIKLEAPAIAQEDLPDMFSYLGGCVRKQGACPISIGGMPDHVHLLATLPATLTLSEFVKNVKMWSSKWIKTRSPKYAHFAWQDGYGAFSVSSSVIPKAVAYISNQAEHHKKRSFREEYISFLKSNNIPYDEKYL